MRDRSSNPFWNKLKPFGYQTSCRGFERIYKITTSICKKLSIRSRYNVKNAAIGFEYGLRPDNAVADNLSGRTIGAGTGRQ
jgi:hypothetical protein